MLFMVRPMPAITEQTAKNQDGRDCNSKSHEVLRLRQDVKAHNPGAHRGEREAHHGCHSEFRRTWHRGAKRAQDRCNHQGGSRCGPSGKHEKCRSRE